MTVYPGPKEEAVDLRVSLSISRLPTVETQGCTASDQLLAFQEEAFFQVPVRVCGLLASGPWGPIDLSLLL